MRNGTAVIDLDVTQPLTPRTGFEQHTDAEVLCRLRDRPLGFVRAPIDGGLLTVDIALREFLARHARAAGILLAERAITSGRPPRWPDAGALIQSPAPPAASGPLVTVAVCVSGPSPHLRRALDAIIALDYRPLDVLVIDHGSTSHIEAMLRAEYPDVRYVRAAGPNVAAAHALAFTEARGDILAFTTDNAVVDRYWASAIARAFLADPEVMVVTGLVVPHALRAGAPRFSTDHVADAIRRCWYRASIDCQRAAAGASAGSANIAFWRDVLGDPSARDTVHTVLYEPSALVRCDCVNRAATQAGRIQGEDWLRMVPPFGRKSSVGLPREIDLADPLRAISDAKEDERLRLTVLWEGARLGQVGIDHHGATISAAWLTDVIAQQLTTEVLDAHTRLGDAVLWSTVTATMARGLMPVIEASRRERRRRLSEAA